MIPFIDKPEAWQLTVRAPPGVLEYKHGCAKRLDDERDESY